MILDRIRTEMDRMSDQQKIVGQYILERCETAAFLTASKLAEATDVSVATVIRFANRVGCSHYSELQGELRDVVRNRLSQMDRFSLYEWSMSGSPMMRSANRIMRTDMRSIEQTLQGLSEGLLQTVVKRISAARRVYILALHSEYGLACYFSSTLCWIRDNVYLIDATHSPTFDDLAGAGAEDVILCMSFPPHPAASIRYFDAAIGRGATGIAITDSSISPLAKRAKYTLYVRDRKISFADNVAPLASLLSTLLSLISSENSEMSSKNLQKKQQYWEDIGFYYDDESK